MEQFDLSAPQTWQHVLTAGTFTGVEIGRASATLGASTSGIVVKSRSLGSGPNGAVVKIVNPGRAASLSASFRPQAENEHWVLEITPAHNGTAITSTAAEVVAYLNDYGQLTNTKQRGWLSFLAASPLTTGAGVVAAGSATLSGGSDIVMHSTVRQTSGTAGGLFYFNQHEALEVLSFEFALGSSVAYTISTLSYDGLSEVTGETVVFASGTSMSATIPGQGLILPRGRAIKIVSGATGMARVTVRRASKFR